MQPKGRTQRPSYKWQMPVTGFIKINSDGALRNEDSIGASGVVARDANSFRGAACKVYEGISEPLIIDALALRDVVASAVQQGFPQVVFEVDCAVLLQHWNDRVCDRSVIKPVLDEISELYNSLFLCSFVFACREANQAAHCCAKFASLQRVSCAWNADPPAFLADSLSVDCNSVILN